MTRKEYRKRVQEYLHKSTEEIMLQRYESRQTFNIDAPTCERHIFDMCKGQRTQKRVRNRFSTEQAGTCGTYVRTMRFENSYITKVCKSRNLY